jgi:uncharacterized membrane protein
MPNNTQIDPKAVSVISYLWLLGWVIAFILHNQQPSRLGAFHLRQSLGIMLLGAGIWALNLIAGLLHTAYLGWTLSLGLFVLWIIGLVSAVKGEEQPLPLLGEQFQRWFKDVIK